MLEKDIENLLSTYTNEFLPDRQLKLVGQQVRLGSYRADIIFQENPGTKLIVEVKKGLFMRDAVGQIADYYGLLKQEFPEDNIKLMIAANVIPKERTIFLRDKLGIEFLELPISMINKVAAKHGYVFKDSYTPEQKASTQQTLNAIEDRVLNYRAWIFQANPQRYDILNALSDERLDVDVWLVNQYKDYIKKGDIGLIWMSGKEAGIYAVIDIMSDPDYCKDSPMSTRYWTSDEDKDKVKLRIKFKYKIKLINDYISREELKNIPGLRNMKIFKMPQATNFPVTKEEWQIISKLIEKKIG
ncbi:MAG: EVE domain-containing protein [Candidatus Omnitrophica bacterium]|nr:EVE domain-containing protein [Candidatus Omnitrophota bacterium]